MHEEIHSQDSNAIKPKGNIGTPTVTIDVQNMIKRVFTKSNGTRKLAGSLTNHTDRGNRRIESGIDCREEALPHSRSLWRRRIKKSGRIS